MIATHPTFTSSSNTTPGCCTVDGWELDFGELNTAIWLNKLNHGLNRAGLLVNSN